MKREHLFSLDFVRVLAAVMIVIFHYNAVTLMIPEVNKPCLLYTSYSNQHDCLQDPVWQYQSHCNCWSCSGGDNRQHDRGEMCIRDRSK